MKKYFYSVLIAVFAFILGLIFYGSYLNYKDEVKISARMADHTVTLKGEKAKIRDVYLKGTFDTVNFYSKDKIDAVALIDGRITAINVEKNDDVKRGQTLLVLKNESHPIKLRQADIDILKAENDIIKAENEIVKAETLLSSAQHDLNRYTRLREREAVSAEKYEQIALKFKEAQFNLQSLKVQKEQAIAQKESLEAQKEQILIESSYSNVTAPIDGEILILYRQLGAFVNAGTSLALIGDFSTLYFEIATGDSYTRALSLGGKMTLNFEIRDLQKIYGSEYNSNNEGEHQNFEATLVNILPSLDEPAVARKTVWKLDNSSGVLEAQTYSGVTYRSVLPHKCLTVPVSAFIDQTWSSVFVFNADNTIKKVDVVSGIMDGEFVEIISGLKEGDIVITSNVNTISEDMGINFILEEGDDVGK